MNDEFANYWFELTAKQKRELAERASTSVVYLSQIANGHRNAGRKIISRLIEADSQISLSMFFDAA